MIRPIMKLPTFLAIPSTDATPADANIGQDLKDTLAAHADECVGLAANMIGVRKRVIVAATSKGPLVMFNPEIVKASGEYEAEEGCLSLEGARPCARYERITVSYLDESFTPHKKAFSGFEAQIIQHEVDHCNGILI